MEGLTRKLFKALKLYGFNLRSEFCALLVEKFSEKEINLEDKETFDVHLRQICDSLENQCLTEKSIEQEHIDRVIEICFNSGYDRHETILNVINAFDFPKLAYNHERKVYYIDTNKPTILPDANIKAKLFLERYYTIFDRIQRHFQQRFINESSQLHLQTIDYLLTVSYATLEHTLILGSLLQVSEGKFFLEDPTGKIELDLSHAIYKGGFFAENSFVLVNGYCEDKTLHVSTIALPPGEEYENSKSSFGNLNYFGGSSDPLLRDSAKLKEHMDQNRHKLILLFSDVWLDHPQIFGKLEYLFEGFQQIPPIAFIFMGNFTSSSQGSDVMDTLKRSFKKLADLIVKYTKISTSSHFVFVPGLSDPCTPYILPRFPLPNNVTEHIKKTIPKATFTTNPCRIQYCTREIVVCRVDLVTKFLQSSLNRPSKDDIANYVKKTIISQGHISPLCLNSQVVHWDFDYCLRLYPLPDIIVVGDKAEAFHGEYKGCQVVNPGSFCDSGFQFKAYCPFTNTLDDCDLEVNLS